MKFSNAALAITLSSGSYVGSATASRLNIMKPSLLTTTVLLSNGVLKASGQSYFPFVKLEPDGVCKGSVNTEFYPQIAAVGSGFSANNPQPCINWCTQANKDKLVGLQMHTSVGSCACLFDSASGAAQIQLTDYTNPSPVGSYLVPIGNLWTGEGNINSVDPSQNQHCYRNEAEGKCYIE